MAFSSVGLSKPLVDNLASLGYEQMTPIQAQSLPAIIAGNDVIAQAKTGSGKTAAFGLGLLNKLDVKRFRIQTMVLCPTRELADQVAKELRKLARGIHNIKILTLCGGVPMGPQIGSLEHGAHIIVGTPGRIVDHLERGRLHLDDLTTLVLDEADRMLEMGFSAALDTILDYTPLQRQTLLFSATFPKQIEQMAKDIMVTPVTVKVASTHDTHSIEQHFYQVADNHARLAALKLLLLKHRPESAVVFCNMRRETQEVADTLAAAGFSVLELNGDLEQRDRDQTLIQFANKSASILVATDVAARGLDIDALDLVVNYQLAYDSEVHIHRIGRTGRAGAKGQALSLYTESEAHKLVALEDTLGITIDSEALPTPADVSMTPPEPVMITIHVDAGKKQKIRPGDILGALTGENGIAGSDVGKIQVTDYRSYVAVRRSVAKVAVNKISKGKLKGRTCRAWLMNN
ncbi:ATP-dependent RNA helicase DbpA [Shewanella marina]|uniref:ATP-dependent RNA helicase DbpA n=1 Tax=Shewanella marina TaxID=487319 RepID=UPI000561DAE1|nr:ATP-dependent RNA helicase DbpA [Shewanella marina]